MKNEKTLWVFLFYKYGKFWSISPEQKVELKPFFSEECYGTQCKLHFINEKYAQFPKGFLVATHISCWITYIERPCPQIQCDVYCIQNAIEVNSWYPARIVSIRVASDKSAPKETPNKDVIEYIYVKFYIQSEAMKIRNF